VTRHLAAALFSLLVSLSAVIGVEFLFSLLQFPGLYR